MLLLVRKKGEQIIIGDDIIISVVKMWQGQVKLGIEAPMDLPINRLEVYRSMIMSDGHPISLAAKQKGLLNDFI